MKVLYSCLSQSWGGIEMFTIRAVQKLLERNISATLLCYPNSKIHKKAMQENIETFTTKTSGYFNPVQTIKVSRFISTGKFDLVHTHATKDLWILSPALILAHSKIPLFITKHVGSFIVKKDVLHKFIYRRVTTAFAISKVIRKNLIDTVPLPERKIRILHDAIDTTKFNPEKINNGKVRKEFKIKDDEIVIGMLARFSKGKGHEEFLLAAKILSVKFDNLVFMIVGEPSRGEEQYEKKIRDLCSEYNLNDKVIFTGFRSDIPEVLASMDIFAFPSHAEAFGIALVEAMAMQKPSVASNSDGVLDILVDNVTGLLFENGNASDLASKIEQLIISDEKRVSYGKAARKRAVELFDFEYFSDKVIDIYNQTIETSK